MLYSELFIGRSDTYAQAYKRGKGYRPIKHRLTPAVIARHIQGENVIGLYLIRAQDNSVRVMVLDIDRDDVGLVRRITSAMVQEVPDRAILVERTGGRGWHIWIFSEDWVEARIARGFLRSMLAGVKLTYPVEIYPKQDRVRSEGVGNLVRLPLGLHQRTGEPGTLYSAFMEEIVIEEDDTNPDLPILPAPAALFNQIGEAQIDRETGGTVGASGATMAPQDHAPATLPCISRFQAGVDEGFRDEAMFKLASYLNRQQIPMEAAVIVLEGANANNRPPLDRHDLETKLSSAYAGVGSLPCNSDLVGVDSPFCAPDCPVYPTAKASRGTGTVVRSGSGIRFPRIAERDGIYLLQNRTKAGITEKVLSNFTMEIVSRLEMPGGEQDVLRVRIMAQSGREDIVDFPVQAFSSRAALLRMLARAEYAWYGSDINCQYLKSHLTGGEMDTKKAVTRVGRAVTEEGDIWVTPGEIVTKDGAVAEEDSGFTYHRPEHFGIVRVSIPDKSFTKSKMKEAMKSLLSINSLSVMVPVIGWMFAVPFKAWFMERLGHFPLMMLYGTRGAGKTQLVQRGIMPLFGYSSKEPQVHFCDTTRFVLVSYGASTTTIPIFYDEYRPNALSGTKLRQLWDHWRHIYAGDTDYRGQADLTRLTFRQTSPTIIAGEEMVIDPAMQERMVQVAMSPDYLTVERQRAFRSMPPMEMASREFIRACLSTDPTPLWDRARERLSGRWERLVSPRIYDNLLVVAFGLELWAKMSGRSVTQGMSRHIFDLSGMVTGDEGDVRTGLWVDDFLLDVAHIVEERGPFTWGMVEEGRMYINLRKAHSEWAKDMRARGEQAVGLQPIRRQLGEKASTKYILERSVQKRMMGANTRVYVFDLDGLREALDE